MGSMLLDLFLKFIRQLRPTTENEFIINMHTETGVLPRPIVGSVGMCLSDASRGLSRSGLRRECGLVARHLVRVVVVTDILHIFE